MKATTTTMICEPRFCTPSGVAETGGGTGGKHKKPSPVSTPGARSTARSPALPRAGARSRPHPGRALSIDTRFTHLATKRVEFALVYERDSNGLISAPISKGKEIWGRASVISGKNAWLASTLEQQRELGREPEKFFLVEIVKPVWEKFRDKPDVREALLHHELMHCDVELDSGKLSIKPHDVEEFNATLRQYGLWKADLELFMQAGVEQFSLLPMMEASAANDSEMFDLVTVKLPGVGETQISRAQVIALWRELELQREHARKFEAAVERGKNRVTKRKTDGVTATLEFNGKVFEV